MNYYTIRIFLTIIIIVSIITFIRLKKYEMTKLFYRRLAFGSLAFLMLSFLLPIENYIYHIKNLDKAIKYIHPYKKYNLLYETPNYAFFIDDSSDLKIEILEKNNSYWKVKLPLQEKMIHIETPIYTLKYKRIDKNTIFILIESKILDQLKIQDNSETNFKKETIKGKAFYYKIENQEKYCITINDRYLCI